MSTPCILPLLISVTLVSTFTSDFHGTIQIRIMLSLLSPHISNHPQITDPCSLWCQSRKWVQKIPQTGSAGPDIAQSYACDRLTLHVQYDSCRGCAISSYIGAILLLFLRLYRARCVSAYLASSHFYTAALRRLKWGCPQLRPLALPITLMRFSSYFSAVATRENPR